MLWWQELKAAVSFFESKAFGAYGKVAESLGSSFALWTEVERVEFFANLKKKKRWAKNQIVNSRGRPCYI